MSELTRKPQQPTLAPMSPEVRAAHGGPFADLVEHLLRPETTAEIPEEIVGEAIADRFIGQLARNRGVVRGDGTREDVPAVLKQIDQLAKVPPNQHKQGFAKAVNDITRMDGLRVAALDLSSNPRTGQLVGRMAERVRVDKDGKLTLLTLAQIEGYLHASVGKKSLSTAAHVIADGIAEYANGSRIVPAWQAQDLLSSDVPDVRDPQLSWEHAVSTATRDGGVDMDLVTRSAEAVHDLHVREQQIGGTALHGALPDYSEMFR